MMQRCHRKKQGNGAVIKLLLAAMILLVVMSATVQAQNHSYPRIGVFHFGIPAPPEWYARFDLVIIRSKNTSLARNVKSLNPNTLIFSTTDWNAGAGLRPEEHTEWIARTSKGELITIYSAPDVFTFNFSNLCPKLEKYGNKRYNEYLPEYLIAVHRMDVFDGVATDGLWIVPREAEKVYGDIDLDQNGINDYDEHGKDWVNARWEEGIALVFEKLWQLMPQDKMLIVNSGRLHDYFIPESNGCIAEHHGPVLYWDWTRGQFDKWYKESRKPHVLFYDARGWYKTQFSAMRFSLGVTMYTDVYYSFSEKQLEHHYDMYYDEYDVDLGFPLGPMQRLTTTGDFGEGVWVRFFDKGAVILNMDRVPATVTSSQIATLKFYNGPYYRFKGGQDPDFNNGQPFDEVTLKGSVRSTKNDYLGDAILLVKQPTTAIADIFIDSDDEGTSPSSRPAEFLGGWTRTNDNINDAWCLSYRDYKDAYALAYSPPGSGENTAIFRPKFGVSGDYEVYEWHGNKTDVQEASNVPCEIHHANEVDYRTIDQSVNYGKWNYLGTYDFKKGENDYVKITNKANGYVIADAFKFVYVGSKGIVDDLPPNSPTNLMSNTQTESSIGLQWTAPSTASDGDGASLYQLYRDDALVGISNTTTYLDSGLANNRTYQYAVYAIDDAGNRSTSAATGSFSTLSETTPPQLVGAEALSRTTVDVKFNEIVEQASAETITNYTIDNNISVFRAVIQENLTTVRLTTSEHTVGIPYTVTVNNVKDLSLNVINPNSSTTYIGVANPIVISMAADNEFELYVNEVLIGSGNDWGTAKTFFVSPSPGNTVIAVKATNFGQAGGLLAEINMDGKFIVTNTSWKVSAVEQPGWNSIAFDDSQWEYATSYGLHGEAQPWASYHDVEGISTTNNVHWIWRANVQDSETIYFRYTINSNGDLVPPAAPTGIMIIKP